jgi:NAD(P)-dependent dehydrogenase (short-subunit alcohol dehydrogenase family)
MIAIDLSGKTALICGAGGGGLGSAVSSVLAGAGAKLVAVDQSQALLEETKAQARQLGVSCATIMANLMDPAQAADIVSNALSQVERIDIVVNVAGGTRFHQWAPLEETSDEIFHDVLALNLNYVFRVCADAARHMISAGHPGSMVNFASIAALRSAPFHGPYGVAKRGVIALTETMAIEWARYGVRANVVAPGGVATERSSQYGGRDGAQRASAAVDGLRRMTPPEVASAVAFLASDLAAGISGQTLVVDSGMACKNPAGGVAEYDAVMKAGQAHAAAAMKA